MKKNAMELAQKNGIYALQTQEPASPKMLSASDLDNSQWSLAEVRDYVNAFIMNEAGEVMVMENSRAQRAWGSWQIIGCYVEEGADPLGSVQETLLDRTGYASEQWTYLGTFVVDDQEHLGVGHFFCAKYTRRVAEAMMTDHVVKWVPRKHIKYALLDGRISLINNAIATTLAMVLCNDD
jgi:hypothetical protein